MVNWCLILTGPALKGKAFTEVSNTQLDPKALSSLIELSP